VDVQYITAIEGHKQVLANGVRIGDGVSVQQYAITKSALRAGDRDSFAEVMTAKLRRNSVYGMSLGHA
jgi:hypothetical protein